MSETKNEDVKTEKLHPIFDARKDQIEYSPGQKIALEKIATFLEAENERFFLLAGFSGTGKTTIAENIVKFAKADVLAPTNTAVNRLKEKIVNSSANFMTIHRCLFSPKGDNGDFKKEKSFERNRVYLIDEVSMIDRYVLETIIADAIDRKCKIIFLGDSFQLEPIGDDPQIFKWEKSYPEHFLPHNRYELTEVRRYDGSLLKIATQLRTTKKAKFLNPTNSDLKMIPVFTKELGVDIDSNNSFVILTATNVHRLNFNKQIRQFKHRKLFNKENLPEMILPNERLISISNGNSYSNGEIFEIKDNVEFIETFQLEYVEVLKNENQGTLFGSPAKPKTLKVLTFHLYKVKNPYAKEKDSDSFEDIFALNKSLEMHSNYILFSAEIKEPSFHGATLLKALKKNSGLIIHSKVAKQILFKKSGYDAEKYYFNKNVTIATYGYAVSTHKSQGNEWDNVYISAPFLVNSWDHARWFYTAITRAKKKVELMYTSFIQVENEKE